MTRYLPHRCQDSNLGGTFRARARARAMVTSLNWDISEYFWEILRKSGQFPRSSGHLGRIWDVFHVTQMKFPGRTVGKWDTAVGTFGT